MFAYSELEETLWDGIVNSLIGINAWFEKKNFNVSLEEKEKMNGEFKIRSPATVCIFKDRAVA